MTEINIDMTDRKLTRFCIDIEERELKEGDINIKAILNPISQSRSHSLFVEKIISIEEKINTEFNYIDVVKANLCRDVIKKYLEKMKGICDIEKRY